MLGDKVKFGKNTKRIRENFDDEPQAKRKPYDEPVYDDPAAEEPKLITPTEDVVSNNSQLLADVGLKEIMPGLIVGQAVCKSGEMLYLGFEKMTGKYWYDYASSLRYPDMVLMNNLPGSFDYTAPYLIGSLIKIAQSRNLPIYPSGMSQIFESEKEYQDVMSYLKTKGVAQKLIHRLKLLEDGIIGFLSPCNGICDQYVVYASKTPIETYQSQRNTKMIGNIDGDRNEKNFYLKHNNILMCFVAATKPNSISFTHMGIFSSPFRFLYSDNRYKDISMILHGFAAQVECTLFNSQLMANRPAHRMREIILSAVGKEGAITEHNTDDEKNSFYDKFGLPNNALEEKTLFHKAPSIDSCSNLIADSKRLAKIYQEAQPNFITELNTSVDAVDVETDVTTDNNGAINPDYEYDVTSKLFIIHDLKAKKQEDSSILNDTQLPVEGSDSKKAHRVSKGKK